MHRIVSISATGRPGNYTSMALAVVNGTLTERGCTVEVLDGRELTLAFPGQEPTDDALRLQEAVKPHALLLIPEDTLAERLSEEGIHAILQAQAIDQVNRFFELRTRSNNRQFHITVDHLHGTQQNVEPFASDGLPDEEQSVPWPSRSSGSPVCCQASMPCTSSM